MMTIERRVEIAEEIAGLVDGKAWQGDNEIRVYVRRGNKEGYIRISPEGELQYEGKLRGVLYEPLVAAGLVSLSDTSKLLDS